MRKNKKTATVTWVKHYNYGSYLQAYALQQTILRLGFENTILDDTPIIEEGRTKNYSLTGKMKKTAGKIYRYFISLNNRLLRKYRKLEKQSALAYNSFKKDFLNIDYQTIPLENLDKRYEQFICGSDQIWAPVPYIFSPFYYLNFTRKKKIAYAPSIGKTSYPEKFISKTKPLIQAFDYLSVREKQGAEILKQKMGLNAEVVLDPTLLPDLNDWNKLLDTKEQNNFTEPYILCYFLSDNTWYLELVDKVAKRKQLPVKILCTNLKQLNSGYSIISGGPLEFLKAIKNANCIITDSYHGTIFSLIFEKEFFTLNRFSEKSENNQNSRVENLFSIIRKENYFIGENDTKKTDELPPLDYTEIKTVLAQQREKSINYLSRVLNETTENDGNMR